VMQVAVERGGVRAAVAAVDCLSGGSTEAARLVARVARGVCGGEVDEPAVGALETLARRHGLASQIVARASECDRPTRRTLIRLAAGEQVSDEAWVRGLQQDDRPRLFSARLSAADPDGRRILVLALDPERGPVSAIAQELSTNARTPPNPEECRRAARVYAADSIAGYGPDQTRQHLLVWIARAGEDGRRAAAEVIEGAGWEERPIHAAALVLLRGDARYTPAAVRGMDLDRVYWSGFARPSVLWNHDTLAAYALVEAGCTRAQVRQAARASRRGEDVPVCPR